MNGGDDTKQAIPFLSKETKFAKMENISVCVKEADVALERMSIFWCTLSFN